MTKRLFVSKLALATVLLTTPAFAAGQHLVTSNADSGVGSLRAALTAASAGSGPQTIAITASDAIQLAHGLVYEGTEPLTIVGTGQSIVLSADETILTVSNGADLTMSGLSLSGPGGFDINNRSARGMGAGKGIFVDLRDDQTGMVRLVLNDVSVRDVAGHGIHLSDCSLADDCGGGSGGAGEGSEASISVVATGVTVERVGYGRFDADGLRVDERSGGDIFFVSTASSFNGVGADGVELDEGQAGDVVVHVTGGTFNENGGYCDPAILGAFMPTEPEGEFEQGAVMEDAVPAAITGSPDDGCFEREVDLYDDGSVEEYEFAIDTDDGFDVDEAGPGSIRAIVIGAAILNNLDEGLDYDEEDAGGIELTLIGTMASGNVDDAYKNSEEGAGDVTGIMIGVTATDNGGVGAVFEEEDGGDVFVSVSGGATSGNDGGDLGLEVVQDDEGMGKLTLMSATITDGIEAVGVETSGM